MTDHVLKTLMPHSLYVHIPFCHSRCFYCDFTTYVADATVREKYVDHLVKEIELVANAYTKGERVVLDTVFFGGGTPTLLSEEEWTRIAQAIDTHFTRSDTCEWTVEANPGSTDDSLYETLRALGVNRISFGAQTFNDGLLQAIGRLHLASDVKKSVERARQAGFQRINLDLMLGLPDQTIEDALFAVDEVLRLKVTHISAYGLKIEAGTPFAKWQQQGLLTLPGEDLEVAMYEAVRSRLLAHGFVHYEISNFATLGEQARHNLVYWTNLPYFAVGVGAHGYVFGERYENVRSLAQYALAIDQGRLPLAAVEAVTAQEAMEDTMMLGLRLHQGVSMNDFQRMHGVPLRQIFGRQVDDLLAKGLLVQEDDRLRIEVQHYEVANLIFEAFIGVCS